MTEAEYRAYKKKQAELSSQQQTSQGLNSTADAVGSAIPVYGQIYGASKAAEGIGRGMIKKDSYGQPKGSFNKALDSEFTPLHEQTINDISSGDWGGLALNTLLGGQYHTINALFGGKTKQQKEQIAAQDILNSPTAPVSDPNQTFKKVNTTGQNAAGFITDPNTPVSTTQSNGIGLSKIPQVNSGVGLSNSSYGNQNFNFGGNYGGNYAGTYGQSYTAPSKNSGGYKSGNPYGGYGGYVQAGVGIGQAIAGYEGLQHNQMPEDLQMTSEMQAALRRSQEMAKQGYTQQEIANYMQSLQRMNNQRYRMGVNRAGQSLSNAVAAASNYGNIGGLNQFTTGDAAERRANIHYSDILAGKTQNIADMNNARHWQLWNQKEQAYGGLMQTGLNNAIIGAGNINYGNNTTNDPNTVDGLGYRGSDNRNFKLDYSRPQLGQNYGYNGMDYAPYNNNWGYAPTNY